MSLLPPRLPLTYTKGRFYLGTEGNSLAFPVNDLKITYDIPNWEYTISGQADMSQYLHPEWVTMKKKEEKKETPMTNETITRSFHLAENNHTEYGMDARLTGSSGTKIRVANEADKELKDFFESAKAGDSFLLVLVKQSKS